MQPTSRCSLKILCGILLYVYHIVHIKYSDLVQALTFLGEAFSPFQFKINLNLYIPHLGMTVWLLQWGLSPLEDLYLPSTMHHKTEKHRQTSTPIVGIELMIPAFKWMKITHASDNKAAVIRFGTGYTSNSRLSRGRLTSLLNNHASSAAPPQQLWCPAKNVHMLVNRACFTVILWQQHVRVGVCHGKTGWGYC
jgi:hypothetical protein